MPDKQHHTPTGELSYYGSSLLSYPKGSHPELIAESEFIAERADSATQTYSGATRPDCNRIGAEEITREELCRGLHFSSYSTLISTLWGEFEVETLEDTARQATLHLLPLCRGVLEKYDLTDSFANVPDCELFCTEPTGTIQILLEDDIQQENPPPPEYRRAGDGLCARQGTMSADSRRRKDTRRMQRLRRH